MRDHMKLRVFELADELALIIYQATKDFPGQETYRLTSQMRIATVSVPSNPGASGSKDVRENVGSNIFIPDGRDRFWKAKGITLSVQPCQTAGILQRV